MTMAPTIIAYLSEVLGAVFPPEEPLLTSKARQFSAIKELCEKDEIIIAMLNSPGHEGVPFCVCDPDQPDLPIIFASDGFCAFTGYQHNEIEGRNCRFLQGTATKPSDVDRIRNAIHDQEAVSVNLLNYRKDGSTFNNEFFLSPLQSSDNKVAYVSWNLEKMSLTELSEVFNEVCRRSITDSHQFLVYYCSLLECNAQLQNSVQDRHLRISGK
jgi:PAS domain S-box-containing protein